MSNFKPKIFIPSNIRSDKRNNSLITESFLNNSIDLMDWMGINLQTGNNSLFLAQNGTWQSVGGSITGDPNQVLYFDFAGNIDSDAGFIRDVLGATTKIYADESNIFGGVFLNGAVGQFGYSNNSISLNNYYYADSANLGWTIGSNTWILPTADGSLGDVLTTDGTGTLSWSPSGGGGFTFDNGLSYSTPSNIQLGGTLIQDTIIDYIPTTNFIGFGDFNNGIGAALGNLNGDGLFLDVTYQFDRFQKVTLISDVSYNLDINPANQNIEFNIIKDDEFNYGLNVFDNAGARTSNIYYGTRVETSPGSGIYSTLDVTRVEANMNNAHSMVLTSPVSGSTFNGHRVTPTYSQLEFDKVIDDGQTTGNTWTLDSNGFSAYVNGTSQMTLSPTGELKLTAYVNGRDDTASTGVLNQLYTDSQGNLLSTFASYIQVGAGSYGGTINATTLDYHIALQGAGTGTTTVDLSNMGLYQVIIISDVEYKAGANNIVIDAGTGNTITSLTGINQTYTMSVDGESITIHRVSSNKFKII